MKRAVAVLATAGLLVAVTVAVVITGSAGAATMSYTATLAGTNEVPSLDNGYTGTAMITVDTTTFEVCVSATTDIPGSDPIILDHIHDGAAGTNGPVVVNFNNDLATCVTSTADIVGQIVADPAGFYFNVHTEAYQGGAVRGQLVLDAPATSSTTASTVAPTTAPSASAGGAVASNPTFTG